MNARPHLTVAAVIERNGRFLMVEERDDHGAIVYNQPAGHVEDAEGLVQAAVRETLEETGWHLRPAALTGIYRWTKPGGPTFVRACFCGQVEAHDPNRPLDEGILRALWMSRDELVARPEALRSPLVLRCIDDYLAGTRYPLNLVADVESQSP